MATTMTQEDIQIADIEKELTELWEKHKGANRVRACLFNLVVFNCDPRRHAYLQSIINSMVSKFPCRIIFIQMDENESANNLHVTVLNEVVGKGSVACDHILIKVSPLQLHKVPLIVLPHFVPDLPIYLLWGQNPATENTILPYLLPHASRLIFDSDCTNNLPKLSGSILKLMQEHSHLEFIDLNWVRTKEWRNVIQRVFDIPIAIQRLRLNKGIKITYNDKQADFAKHVELQAIYLTAWLITQMQWQWITQKDEEGIHTVICKNPQQEFAISLYPNTFDDLNPGSIAEVEVLGYEDISYLISHMENLPKAVVHISSMETCELPYTLPLPGLKNGSVTTTDLIFSPPSNHYRNMLELLQRRNTSCLIEACR